MPDPNRNFIDEWRTADRMARTFERELALASLNALDGGGASPTAEVREKARQLRDLADDLFQAAMAATKDRVEELRR
jgi:hypothetical protein